MLPIPIPTKEKLDLAKELFNEAIIIKQAQFRGDYTIKEAEEKLEPLQKLVDSFVCELYGFTKKEAEIINSAVFHS